MQSATLTIHSLGYQEEASQNIYIFVIVGCLVALLIIVVIVLISIMIIKTRIKLSPNFFERNGPYNRQLSTSQTLQQVPKSCFDKYKIGDLVDKAIVPKNKITKRMSREECTICLLPLKDNLVAVECFHNFHPECIKEWRVNHETCPNCR